MDTPSLQKHALFRNSHGCTRSWFSHPCGCTHKHMRSEEKNCYCSVLFHNACWGASSPLLSAGTKKQPDPAVTQQHQFSWLCSDAALSWDVVISQLPVQGCTSLCFPDLLSLKIWVMGNNSDSFALSNVPYRIYINSLYLNNRQTLTKPPYKISPMRNCKE